MNAATRHNPRRIAPRPARLRMLGFALPAALLLVAISGCGRPLLSPEDQRTPFDSYDAVRNQFAQQYIEDEFGRLKPNLRSRLSPRD